VASNAQRRRDWKKRAAARRTEALAPGNDNAKVAAPRAVQGRPRQAGRDDGLDFLQAKGRVTRPQAAAGRRYGALYRTSLISGAASLRSCLDIQEVRGGGRAVIPKDDFEAAVWIADAKAQLAGAQAALSWHTGMILACDMICGRGLRPREILEAQRDTEQLETALRLALDLLIRHFAKRLDA